MDNTKIPSAILRISLALMIDVITLLLIFPIWLLTDFDVFPYAIASIGISVMFLNYLLIRSEYIVKTYSVATFYSIAVTSCFYYILTILFTWISHKNIIVPWYILVTVILLGFYVAIVSGLRVSGAKHIEDVVSIKQQTYQKINLGSSFLEIKDLILELKDHNSNHVQLVRSFDTMKERFETSTPFGRGSKAHIMEMEGTIELKIEELKNRLKRMNPSEDNSDESIEIVTEFEKLRQMIMNREKLFVN